MAQRVTGNTTIQRLLIFAQVLSLTALLMGLWFFLDTTGGTLFLFSAVAPAMVSVAISIVGFVAYQYFRRQHRLFDILHFADDEIIVRQGDTGDCMYFVQHGDVKVERDGAEIATLCAGTYFGETALLTEELRNATVRSVGDTQLASLGKANFLTMLRLMPWTKGDVMATIQETASKQA